MSNQRAAELMVQGRDLPWLLNQWVQRTPEQAFLIWAPATQAHRTWTYADFEADVRKLAGGLQDKGIKKGQRLLIHMENSPELLMSHFACAYLGAVAVHTNTRLVQRELSELIDLTEVVGALTQPQFAQVLAQAPPQLSLLVVTDNDAGETPATNFATGPDAIANPGASAVTVSALTSSLESKVGSEVESKNVSFNSLLQGPAYQGLRPAEPMLDLRVQFTSGTTSQPKAVLSTHANVIFAAQQTARAYALRQDDVCQVFVPLFHTNGLTVLVMGSLWVGGAVLLQRKFSASHFWGPALQYKATWSSLPSGFFINALKQYPVPDHYFRFWFIAVLPELELHFKVKTRGHWGMTEMITLPLVGDPHHEGPPLNIGRPAFGNEIAIRRQDGSNCEPGETGNLYVRGIRGITLFKEYLNNPTANTSSFDVEGWFNTGDRIRIDEQGNLFFADRHQDTLRVGGENVSSSEIEAIIRETGWVKECAVVGQRHAMLDEVPVVFVTPAEGAPKALKEDLMRYCEPRLADYKMIRDVFIVDDFPRATLNKIAKNKLREGLGLIES